LKIKLKGCHFDTVEVIQAVLNTFTEHDLWTEFKSGRNPENGAYSQKGTTLKVMVTSRPKVSFNLMAAPVPESINGSLYDGANTFVISIHFI
jgi:hypothetical protein